MSQKNDIQYLDYERPVKKRTNSSFSNSQHIKERIQVKQIFNLEHKLQQSMLQKEPLKGQNTKFEFISKVLEIQQKTGPLRFKQSQRYEEDQDISATQLEQKNGAQGWQDRQQNQTQTVAKAISTNSHAFQKKSLIDVQQRENKISTSSEAEPSELPQRKAELNICQLSKQNQFSEISGIIKQIKFTLSKKTIQQFNADLLFIPYVTLSLQFYPGSWLRPLLKRQITKLYNNQMKDGSIYITSNHEIKNYRFLAFLKVSPQNFSQNFAEGFANMLTHHPKSNIRSLVFGLRKGELDIMSVYDGLNTLSLNYKFGQMLFNFAASEGQDFADFAQKLSKRILKGEND